MDHSSQNRPMRTINILKKKIAFVSVKPLYQVKFNPAPGNQAVAAECVILCLGECIGVSVCV